MPKSLRHLNCRSAIFDIGIYKPCRTLCGFFFFLMSDICGISQYLEWKNREKIKTECVNGVPP